MTGLGTGNLVLPVSDPTVKSLSLLLLAELLQEKDALLMFGSAFHLKRIFSKKECKDKISSWCLYYSDLLRNIVLPLLQCVAWKASSTLQKIHSAAAFSQKLAVKKSSLCHFGV